MLHILKNLKMHKAYNKIKQHGLIVLIGLTVLQLPLILKKGTQVYVEGQPDIRNYTTKEGTPGSSLTLKGNAMYNY